MDHEFYEEVLREMEEFVTEMEMDIEKRRMEEEVAEDNLMLLKKIFGLI